MTVLALRPGPYHTTTGSNKSMAALEFFSMMNTQCHRSSKVSLTRQRGGKGALLKTRLRAVGHRKVDDGAESVGIQPACQDIREVSGVVVADEDVFPMTRI